jgi:hypothetical protein
MQCQYTLQPQCGRTETLATGEEPGKNMCPAEADISSNTQGSAKEYNMENRTCIQSLSIRREYDGIAVARSTETQKIATNIWKRTFTYTACCVARHHVDMFTLRLTSDFG